MPIFKKAAKRFNPARTLVIGFAVIIAAGTLLLCLPISSKSREFTPIFDCLFTATSASCVTGLTIYDTYLHWSLFGQIVIALLIQVGGLGFVTIITFFNVAAGKKLGYRTLKNAAGDLTESSFEGGRSIFVSIIKYSFIFELCGAAVLAAVFVPKYGAYGVWMSVFMSITAFCNAGFDLMGMEGAGTSLISCQNDPAVLITVSLLIIVGGLGFIVWENFLNIRTRKKLSLHTRTVLIMSGILIVGGTVFYLISESGNPATMKDMPFGEKLLNAFFTSVSTRTAGYDSVGMGEMTEFSQLGSVLLMFIGAAPGSTGGGIKVTTLMVLIMTVLSYIRNKNDVELFRHKIDKLTIYRTLVISVLSMFAVGVCFTALYFSMPEGTQVGAVQCLFDAVSAFSTAGLTAGAAALTGTAGKILLIFTMFIGRVGPMSLIMSLVMNSRERKNIVVPDGHILIG
ncbi:MAG: potassium transporter Trk [Lachnospiraceae bacterium]|nr:potassium transporter Trk [Ruminococcus sp.]MCM1275994.1 potassium transporter Trk [Lachnospiraceae bacterium]